MNATVSHSFTDVKRVQLVREGSVESRPRVTNTTEAMEMASSYWKAFPAADQERFVVFMLNTKHVCEGVTLVHIGTLASSLVDPKAVFRPACIMGSSAVIVSHNHPSGDCTPSKEDKKVTEMLKEAGNTLGITVLDHIVYGDGTGNVCSIAEHH